eukprot:19602-Heterococcus_DN1.PRE.1
MASISFELCSTCYVSQRIAYTVCLAAQLHDNKREILHMCRRLTAQFAPKAKRKHKAKGETAAAAAAPANNNK